MPVAFGPRRAIFLEVTAAGTARRSRPTSSPHFETLRPASTARSAPCSSTTCPTSGHPGGSISSGRFVAGAPLRLGLDYDFSRPRPRGRRHHLLRRRPQGDGPLRDVGAARRGRRASPAPTLLPADERAPPAPRGPARLPPQPDHRARRSSGSSTPRRSTGTRRRRRRSCGSPPAPRAWASPARSAWRSAPRDRYGADAPRVHIIEGEGGLTPGRVAEALAAAGTASLGNVVLHLDWNQASIDCDRVCREGDQPGDYVQWDPRELVLPARLERDLRARRARLPAGRRGAAPRAGASTTASRRRSSTARTRAGSTASRARRRTAPATSSAPRASTRRWPSSPATAQARAARLRARPTSAATARGDRTVVRGAASGRRSASCARRIEENAAGGAGAGGAAATQPASGSTARGRTPRAGAPRVEAVYELAARSVAQTPGGAAARSRARRPRCASELGRALQLPQQGVRRRASSSPRPTCSARPA